MPKLPFPLPPRHNKTRLMVVHSSRLFIGLAHSHPGPHSGVSFPGTSPLGDLGVELLVGPVLPDVV